MSDELQRKPTLRNRLGNAKRRLISIRKRYRYTVRRAKRRSIPEVPEKYLRFLQSEPLDENLVVYEASGGAGLVCNPYAIFVELLADPKRQHLRHVWVLADEGEAARQMARFAHRPNVSFAVRNGEEYLRALATAKYVIQNTSYPSFFAKREGQICVDTWHSTTVKTLGYDMPNGNINSRNMVRSFLMSDYLVSPNPFMTRIFRDSYRLQDLYEGKIIEAGYPRNDLTFRSDPRKMIDELAERGVDVDPGKKVILFAPTWRGAWVNSVMTESDELIAFRESLIAQIDADEYQVLIKPHPVTYKALTDEERLSGNYVPQEIDANELFGIVDILVSDYSSVFLDFMVTGRPVLFYVPDREAYSDYRGVYFSFDDLPGPVTEEASDIADWVNRIDEVQQEYRAAYAETLAWACAQDDGQASVRVVKAVFDGDMNSVIADFVPPRKKRLLFYVSSFGANGVSSAFNALVKRIDRSKYDVTVYGFLGDETSRRHFTELSDVRAMPRFGAMTMTRREARGVEYYSRYALDGPLVRLFKPEEVLRRDFKRSFGDAQFDVLIDFSGYGTLFPGTFRFGAPDAKRVIWQHNDLAADIRNSNKRKLKKYNSVNTSLTGLRDTYSVFDRVVSCGEFVMEVNRLFTDGGG